MKSFLINNYPAIGGIVVFLFLFLYGLVNNLSMSYMGNTSDEVVRYIFTNFSGTIILFLLRVLSTYMVIALLIGFLCHAFFLSIIRIMGLSPSRLKLFLGNALATFLVFLTFFLRDIILYPQLYMNNFYNKNFIFQHLVDFLTDHVSPSVFTVLQIVLLSVFLITVTIALFKAYRRKTVIGLISLVLLASIVILVNYFRSQPAPRTKKTPPSLIIFASDALRPDHLSGLGYSYDTSPHIDRLIKEGAQFSRTYIEVPRTFPSWISFLTGQYCSTHGVRHMFPTSRDINRNFSSLVKPLRDKGYYTSVVTDYAGDIFSRVDLGFEVIDTPYFNFNSVLRQAIIESHAFLLPFLTNRTGLEIFPVLKDSAYFCPPDLVRERIIKKIEAAGDRPFFITTFFSSTHFPYAPPYPYYKRYAVKNYQGPYKYFKQRVLSLDREQGDVMTETDIRQVRALYDGGIRAFDDAVGGVIDYLEKKRLLDNTIVIVLSDHGENLYEGNLGMGHGEHFRGPHTIRVPFILRYPKRIPRGTAFNTVCRQVDIAPTLLALLDMPAMRGMEGRSLLPLLQGKKLPEVLAFGETGIWFDNSMREDLFFQKLRIMYPDITKLSEIDFHMDNQVVLNDSFRDLINLAKHRYVFDGRYKLIYMPLRDRVEYELYDTLKDPGEKRNLANTDQSNLRRLKAALFRWFERNGDVILNREYCFPNLRY